MALFQHIDENGDGTLKRSEIITAFKNANGRGSKALKYFNAMDVNNDGDVSMDEYISFWNQVLEKGATEQSIENELANIQDRMALMNDLQRISTQKLEKMAGSAVIAEDVDLMMKQAEHEEDDEGTRGTEVAGKAESNIITDEEIIEKAVEFRLQEAARIYDVAQEKSCVNLQYVIEQVTLLQNCEIPTQMSDMYRLLQRS